MSTSYDLGDYQYDADTGEAVVTLNGLTRVYEPPGGGAYDNVPLISSFSPGHGPPGQQVHVYGQFFQWTGHSVVNVSSVAIAGIPCSHWDVLADDHLTCIAPSASSLPRTGQIKVETQLSSGVALVGRSDGQFTIDAVGIPSGGGGGPTPFIGVAVSALEENTAGKLLILGAAAITAYVSVSGKPNVYPDSIEVADVGSTVTRSQHALSRYQKATSPSFGKLDLAGVSVAGDLVLPDPFQGNRWLKVIAKWGGLGIIASKVIKVAQKIHTLRGEQDNSGPGYLHLYTIRPQVPMYLQPIVSGGAVLQCTGNAKIKSATMQMSLYDGYGGLAPGQAQLNWASNVYKKLFWVKTNHGIWTGLNSLQPWFIDAEAYGLWWPDGDKTKPAISFSRPSIGSMRTREQLANPGALVPQIHVGTRTDEIASSGANYSDGNNWINWLPS